MKTLLIITFALTASGTAFAQSQSAPEVDARGIPVVSAPAVAPSGANQPVTAPAGAQVVVATDQAAAFAPTQASGDLPPCTKTVTDHCKQTYEGRRR